MKQDAGVEKTCLFIRGRTVLGGKLNVARAATHIPSFMRPCEVRLFYSVAFNYFKPFMSQVKVRYGGVDLSCNYKLKM
jgi:hypothetical protein